MDLKNLKKETQEKCKECDKLMADCTCEKEEDSSVNSLGSIPSGGLRKKSVVKAGESKMSIAAKLIKQLSEMDGSPYDASIEVEPFDANKLPEIKNAIINALGEKVSVSFDSAKNCFYVDGGQEEIAKVKEVLGSMEIKVKGEEGGDSKDGSDVAMPAKGADATVVGEVDPTVNAAAESNDEEEPDMGDDGYEIGDHDDEEILKNGRLNDVMSRILARIDRLPQSKRSDYTRILLRDMMKSVEDKSGAPMAMLYAAKDFLKTQF